MFLDIVNYTVRSIVLIIGILLASGVLLPPGPETDMFRVMGIVLILFGVYRIVLYHFHRKRYRRGDEDD